MAGIPREHSSKSGKEGLMRRLLDRRRITDSGCWEYTGGLDGKGYGRVRFKGIPTRGVHRIAAWLWSGFDIESKLAICHRCDNPKCFNPRHLFYGTLSDNIQDSIHKGRWGHKQCGAHQKLRTHCPHGHPYDVENTYWYRGSRRCIACMRDQSKRRSELRKKERKGGDDLYGGSDR